MTNILHSHLSGFEDFAIRRHYDEEKEVWYFSVIDIVAVLTEQKEYKRAKTYWTTLKNRLKNEGSEVVTKCDRLKVMAEDGKMRFTDMTTADVLFRLIQSIPSKKAEPIKLWLAKVGNERLQEMADPALSVDRARENWRQHGRSDKWIQQRMMGQETRNKLTDYWSEHGVNKGKEYAILTNIIHREWTGISVKKHKELKGLKSQNLRDHMSEAELIFTALAELSTRQIAETVQAEGLRENRSASKRGGTIAKKARLELEKKTGKPIVSEGNFLNQKSSLKSLDQDNEDK